MATTNVDVRSMREEYSKEPLDEDGVWKDPIKHFDAWFRQAKEAQLPEPNAACLATATPDGRPSARYVLLKGYDEKGFVWFTNYGSRKASELDENPRASLVFWWQHMERSVRVEGSVERTSREETAEYFRTRPVGSRLGAWASHQSRVVEGGAEQVQKQYDEVKQRFFGDRSPEEARDVDIPPPPFWGGYRLTPSSVEFWKGGTNRLHDRLVYRRKSVDEDWYVVRLEP